MEVNMNKQYEQVREFHVAFNQDMPDKPTVLDQGPLVTNNWLIGPLHQLTQEIKVISSRQFQGEDVGGMVAKRISWMLEELTEFAAADTLEDQVDALTDLIYFALGTFTLMGVKPEPFFDIVHAANMGKLHEDGKPRFNEQGKIIKPEGWAEKYAPEPKIIQELMRQSEELN
jgi:predicted HAD superfamily Cof-like phosphohydrolase